MDNTETIPGYKHYVDEHGGRPDVYVAFLDIQADPATSVNGTCSPVGHEALEHYDVRERNYTRIEITDCIDDPLGRVWTYVGSAAGRRRLANGKEAGNVVISREYLDRVIAGFRALGATEYAAFRNSSHLDGLPVRDLIRIDLPG